VQRIFDDEQAFAVSDGADAVIVSSQTEQIDRDNRFRLQTAFLTDSGDGSFKLFDIQIVCIRVYVDEHRLCANQRNNFRRGSEGERRNEDGITRTDAACHQGHLQGVGAVGAGDDVFHAQIFTELLFEFGHFRSKNITAFRNNLGNGGIETVFDTRALRSKINKLHVGSNISGPHKWICESSATYLFACALPGYGQSVQSFAIPVTPLDAVDADRTAPL